MFYFYPLIFFFSIKMTGEEVKVSLRNVGIFYLPEEDRFLYDIGFRCKNVENKFERGYICFTSDDSEK